MEHTLSTDEVALPEATAPTGASHHGTAARFRALLEDFQQRFDPELSRWVAAKRRQIAREIPESEEIAEGVARLADSGGKRLRPALVWFTWSACGGGSTAGAEAVMPLALATELLHTYLLVHDDIMDHADTRRGLPTAHAELARRHAERGWGGDSADFGRTAAILVGDLAHSWAHELVAEAGHSLPGDRAAAIGRAFAATSQEVLAGQYLEVLLAQRGTDDKDAADADDLARVLRYKSGAYTVERPIELGALAAGADRDVTTPLTAYGRSVGEAFQLQDDVLGTFGDEDETGKPAASDLEEGKLTFLVFHALSKADPSGAAELRAALGSGPLDSERVTRLRGILEASGALGEVRRMIADRLGTARAALGELEGRITAEGHDFLAGLVDYVAERRR